MSNSTQTLDAIRSIYISMVIKYSWLIISILTFLVVSFGLLNAYKASKINSRVFDQQNDSIGKSLVQFERSNELLSKKLDSLKIIVDFNASILDTAKSTRKSNKIYSRINDKVLGLGNKVSIYP